MPSSASFTTSMPGHAHPFANYCSLPLACWPEAGHRPARSSIPPHADVWGARPRTGPPVMPVRRLRTSRPTEASPTGSLRGGGRADGGLREAGDVVRRVHPRCAGRSLCVRHHVTARELPEKPPFGGVDVQVRQPFDACGEAGGGPPGDSGPLHVAARRPVRHLATGPRAHREGPPGPPCEWSPRGGRRPRMMTPGTERTGNGPDGRAVGPAGSRGAVSALTCPPSPVRAVAQER